MWLNRGRESKRKGLMEKGVDGIRRKGKDVDTQQEGEREREE